MLPSTMHAEILSAGGFFRLGEPALGWYLYPYRWRGFESSGRLTSVEQTG